MWPYRSGCLRLKWSKCCSVPRLVQVPLFLDLPVKAGGDVRTCVRRQAHAFCHQRSDRLTYLTCPRITSPAFLPSAQIERDDNLNARNSTFDLSQQLSERPLLDERPRRVLSLRPLIRTCLTVRNATLNDDVNTAPRFLIQRDETMDARII
jgi:hypothetical protein